MIAISLGGNQSESPRWMKSAIQVISNYLFAPKVSKVYETIPLGPGTSQFYNMAIAGLAGGHSLESWWTMCQEMETASGRDKSNETFWGDRILDLDILFYEDHIVSRSDLIIPHPQMHRRPFVLGPLHEVAPLWKHPILGVSVEALWSQAKKNIPSGIPGTIQRSNINLQDILEPN